MARKNRWSGPLRQEKWEGIVCALPWILGFFAFTLGPMVASLILSLFEYDVTTPPWWVGLENYQNIFSNDKAFWVALYNSAYYTILSVPLGMIVALSIAILLNQKIRGLAVYRTIFYLPSVTSGVAVSLLWMWLLDPNGGLVNTVLSYFGVKGPLWLQSPTWSKPALVLMSLWGIGGTMVIYLAGLQGIPKQLYEAASIDGANSWMSFWHVTIPMLSPTIFFTLVIGIIGSFQAFTQAYIMTSGGPVNSTLFFVYYIYRRGFQYLHMGYASALAWILFVILLVFTVAQFRVSSRWVFYEGDTGR